MPKKVLVAETIRVGYCGECDGLHLQLHNADGDVIAVAVLDAEEALQIAEEATAFAKEGATARAMFWEKRDRRLQ